MSTLPPTRVYHASWLLQRLSLSRTSTRNQAHPFFCSNRRNHQGCGHTFSILWSHLIAHTSIAAQQLLALIDGVAQGQPLHRVWRMGDYAFSITTAYRWLARWLRNQSHLRTHLARTHPPPQGVDSTASQRTLTHLTRAYSNEPCRITAFQFQHQQDFLP